MKLEIALKIEPVDPLGLHAVFDWIPDLSARQVFIDGKQVPPGLAKAILLGLDVATEQYLHYIEEMRKEGHYLGGLRYENRN